MREQKKGGYSDSSPKNTILHPLLNHALWNAKGEM